MAKSGIANVVGRAEEVRSQHRHRHQHHHQHQHRHQHRHQHQPTLLLISVPLLRPGRVITRVCQLWRWYFQNVNTLIGIATSHDQLRQARPDQWSEWPPPSHRAPHTALLLRCTGARVTMISSSRVSYCTVQTHSVLEREWFYVTSTLSQLLPFCTVHVRMHSHQPNQTYKVVVH